MEDITVASIDEQKSVNDEKEEDLLWEEFRRTKSAKLRDKFIRQYMPLVKYVAGKVAVGMPNSVEFDDLVIAGSEGLMEAVEKYDYTLGFKFSTYAYNWIKHYTFI